MDFRGLGSVRRCDRRMPIGAARARHGGVGVNPREFAQSVRPPILPGPCACRGCSHAGRTWPSRGLPLHLGDHRAAPEPRAARLADVPPHLRRLGIQPARWHHAGERRLPRSGVDLRHRLRPRSPVAAHRQRRVHVRHRSAGLRQSSGAGARGGDRRSAVAPRPGPAGGCPQAPQQGESRRRPVRRQGLRRYCRRRGRRAGRDDRGGRLGAPDRGPGRRPLRHDGAARRRREGHGRRVGRGVRHSRLRRRARCRHRPRGLEDAHRPPASRAARPGPARRGARAARRYG